MCLLKNDIEVTRNWLHPIIKTFETEIETVVIQPKILDFKNKNMFEYAGAASRLGKKGGVWYYKILQNGEKGMNTTKYKKYETNFCRYSAATKY